jgi:putative transcriptional regulator
MSNSLQHHFLIATPSLEDSLFVNTLIYIFEHNSDGASGIIINQKLDISLSHLFDNITDTQDLPLYFGGPVNPDQGFVLHTKHQEKTWETTLNLKDEICLTASKDIINAISENSGPQQAIIALGFAEWEAQQLEQEIYANDWLHLPATKEILFKTPSTERFKMANDRLGINLNLMSPDVGHA